jgi:outer membrane protein assembly factor BamB
MLLPGILTADDWLQWRGPDYANAFTGEGYPTRFSTTENVLWKTDLPGRAGSSPIFWNNRIYLTSPGNGKNLALCVDLDGAILWQTAVGDEVPGKHKKASGANPSPVSDGKQLFVYYKSGDLAALNPEGKIAWHINVQKKFGDDTLWWDLGTSPVLSKDHLIITAMQAKPSPSYIAAINKEDGSVAWKVLREFDRPKENDQSYTTPVIVNHDGKEILIVWGADHVTAHDLSRNGEEIWRCGGFNADGKGFKRTISSPIPVGDMIIVPYDRGNALAGVKLGGKGDVTETHRAWDIEPSSDVPTPATHDGLVYILGDKGLLSCIDPGSGNILWSEQLPKKAATYSASPVIADGRIYCAREDGAVMVAKAGKDFELLATNMLEGENCYSTPLMVDGRIYIRTLNSLYCIGSK